MADMGEVEIINVDDFVPSTPRIDPGEDDQGERDAETEEEQEQELEELHNASVDSLLRLSKGPVSYRALLRRLAKEMPELPACNIELRGVTSTVEVPVAQEDHAIPTVARNAWAAIKKLAAIGKKQDTRSIYRLHDVSVSFPAGTTTLVLAPPGHGKTSLLQAIAGILDINSGEVLFNGRTAEESEALVPRLAAYVGQDDVHMPQLTVRETLTFAAQNANVTEHLPADSELVQEYARQRVDLVLRLLGLTNCADTIVGNDLIRGVSGGEKRRVSIGELLVTNARCFLLDQYSTGLDASTTIDITRSLVAWAHLTGGVVVSTMLQPPPEVVDMYDNVVVLREGQVVYAGPQQRLRPFFQDLGFYFPPMDTADIVTEIVTHPSKWVRKYSAEHKTHHKQQQEQQQHEDERLQLKITAAIEGDASGTSDTNANAKAVASATSAETAFAKRRRSSKIVSPDMTTPITTGHMRKAYEVVAADLEAHRRASLPATSDSGRLTNEFSKAQYGRPYAKSFGQHLMLSVQRQLRLMSRDPQFLVAHLVQSLFLSLILGSLFWQLSTADFQLRVGLLLFVPTLLAFNNMAEVPVAMAVRDVVYRQYHAGFYSTAAYTLAVNLVHLPLALAESIIFSCGVYWMSGFVEEVDRFFFFLLFLTLVGFSTASMFRIISYAVPSMEAGQVMVGPANAVLTLFSGIMITRANIPPWFIWIYYISPFSWSIRSLALNEFESDRYAAAAHNGTSAPTLGELYLESYELQSGGAWKWYGVLALLVYLVIMVSLSVWVLSRGKPDTSRGTSRVEEKDDENPHLSYTDDKGVGQRADTVVSIAASLSSLDDETNTDSRTNGNSNSNSNSNGLGSVSRDQHALPFEEASLVFKDLCYDVTIKKDKTHKKETTKRLLNNVSGYARAGELTALMGVTGAGKTTLLDVLARRKTGGTTLGNILVNGTVPSKARFARLVGYCEQNDLHEPFSTVEEALHFSAALRLPASIPEEKRKVFVEEVMDLIELSHLRNRIIGSPGQEGGLSQGQRKRLTLGVELVANTSILFLDEPTSQLDSREAEVVMRVVRNVARTGRTVVCTIHQPNAELFSMFDQLLLLAKGGRAVFHGPTAKLQPYFEAIPGVLPKDEHVNPATWMLDVIGASSAGVGEDTTAGSSDGGDGGAVNSAVGRSADDDGALPPMSPDDFPRMYEESELRRSVGRQIDVLVRAADGSADDKAESVDETSMRATSRVQLSFVMRRAFVASWRNVDYNLTRLVVITGLGLLFGLLYLRVKEDDLAGVVSKMAGLFSTAIFSGAINLLTAIPVIVGLRAVVARERAANMYAGWMHSIAMALAEFPYLIVSSLCFLCVFYFMASLSLDGATLILYFLTHIVLAFLMVFISHFFSNLFPTAETATLAASTVMSVSFLFGGLFLPGPAMPDGYRWIWHANFIKYGLNALVVPQFYCDDGAGTGNSSMLSGNATSCPTIDLVTPDGIEEVTVSNYVQDFLGLDYDNRWAAFFAVVGYAVGFWIFSFLAARYINHVKR
ncbi:ABC transporter [Salpingoeca rosetta]|uniref:ABC transporter n=1 Tax=Salpingoeca rosetta (strain ATCC 50818 / BSB-021) TaxID=946362 RepID=F2U483_SALR5|nr:ABC transporter [Salpingoeca rosetta]EGD82449.1 ABC transporter [Salpingoeca rosetta]|eukprot:XP_004995685.1 ABC transporter [Salpingoeca rosetta]